MLTSGELSIVFDPNVIVSPYLILFVLKKKL